MRWRFVTMLVTAIGFASPSAVGEPATGSELSYAESTFVEGQRLYFEKRYQEALPLFEQSFALQPSPNSRLYIARCYAELGALLTAYDEYRRVIVQVSETETPARYAATQMAASEERALLRRRLAVIRVHLSSQVAGLRMFIDDREIAQTTLLGDHLANPGSVLLTALFPGQPELEAVVRAKGGEVTDVLVLGSVNRTLHRVVAAPAPVVAPVAQEHPAADWAWASVGVGVAGLATWGLFATQAERRFYRIQADCMAGECPLDQVQRGRTETLIANVGLGVGLAGLAGAGCLWLWSQGESETRGAVPRKPAAGRLRNPPHTASAVRLDLTAGGVLLNGTF